MNKTHSLYRRRAPIGSFPKVNGSGGDALTASESREGKISWRPPHPSSAGFEAADVHMLPSASSSRVRLSVETRAAL